MRQVPVAGLTEKQRAVLDLLIEHKTSKEIARELGISPHTVDQRLMFAREKLGARNRSEAAMIYRNLVMTPTRTTYGLSHIDGPGETGETTGRSRGRPGADASAGAARFAGRYGGVLRIAKMVALAVVLLLILLAAHSAYHSLVGDSFH